MTFPDWDHEPPRPKLRICRAGFALSGIGLTLLAFSAAVELGFLLSFSPTLIMVMESAAWKWLVGGPITWMTLVGAYLLWGGWADPSWRRKAGLLLLLNSIDGVQWVLGSEQDLGLRLGRVGHGWLRSQVAEGFGWIEFALYARLAAQLLAHVGDKEAGASAVKARALSAVGFVLWAFGFATRTAWRRGWPLMPRMLRLPGWLTLLGQSALTLATSLNVVVLCVGACRRCTRAIAAEHTEEQGLDLLTSRSETAEDEFWK